MKRKWLSVVLIYWLILGPVVALRPLAQAPTGRVRVKDRILTPGGQPRAGKVTFVLLQAAQGPDGLIPAKSTVTGETVNGWFDVWVYPSTSINPQGYYNVLFQPAGSVATENLGVYSFPSSSAVLTLAPNLVTDTSLAARYKLAADATVQNLATTAGVAGGVAGAQAAQELLTSGLSPNALPRYDATQQKFVNNSGIADSLPLNNGDGTVTWVSKDAIAFQTPGTPIVQGIPLTGSNLVSGDIVSSAVIDGGLPASTQAGLPATPTTYRKYKLTDGHRGTVTFNMATGRWVKDNPVYDASNFGAHPSVAAAVNDSALQHALDTIHANGGGTLVLSEPGAYATSVPLKYYSNTRIVFLNSHTLGTDYGTYISYSGSGFAFYADSSGTTDLSFENVSIKMAVGVRGGINLSSTKFSLLLNCHFEFASQPTAGDTSSGITTTGVSQIGIYAKDAQPTYWNTLVGTMGFCADSRSNNALIYLKDSANSFTVSGGQSVGLRHAVVADNANSINIFGMEVDDGFDQAYRFVNGASYNHVWGGRLERYSVPITGLSRTSNITTVTCNTANGHFLKLRVGMRVRITAATDTTFNTEGTIATIGASSFTFAQTGANATPVSDFGYLWHGVGLYADSTSLYNSLEHPAMIGPAIEKYDLSANQQSTSKVNSLLTGYQERLPASATYIYGNNGVNASATLITDNFNVDNAGNGVHVFKLADGLLRKTRGSAWQLAGEFEPYTDGANYLGSSSKRWLAGYFGVTGVSSMGPVAGTSFTASSGTAASPSLVSGSAGLYLTSNYYGFTTLNVTKFFFQNQTDRGIVLAASNPITHVNNADAVAAAPTLRIAPDFTNGGYVIDNNAGTLQNITVRRICYDTANTVCDFAGSGTPETNVAASVGSTYRRTDGGAATSFYVKESGAGTNTGWIAK